MRRTVIGIPDITGGAGTNEPTNRETRYKPYTEKTVSDMEVNNAANQER